MHATPLIHLLFRRRAFTRLVPFIHVACLLVYVFVCLSVYVYDSKSESIAGVPLRRDSADHPITAHHVLWGEGSLCNRRVGCVIGGCAVWPRVCVVIGGLAVWRHNKPKTKPFTKTGGERIARRVSRSQSWQTLLGRHRTVWWLTYLMEGPVMSQKGFKGLTQTI